MAAPSSPSLTSFFAAAAKELPFGKIAMHSKVGARSGVESWAGGLVAWLLTGSGDDGGGKVVTGIGCYG